MVLQDSVFSLDKRIRYCAVLDGMGRVISGGMRPGIKSLEPTEEADRVDAQIAVTRGMAEAAHAYLGKTDYVIIHRQKLLLIAIPLEGDRTVLVSAQPDLPLSHLEALMKIVAKGA